MLTEYVLTVSHFGLLELDPHSTDNVDFPGAVATG